MIHLFAMLFASVIVSGYYFSFEFTLLPGINTKMMLAVVGVFLVIYRGCREHGITITKDFMGAAGLAFIFSLICFIAIDYNHTDDYSYVTYFTSFFTWLGGAYTVCAFIRSIHGAANLRLLTGYLAFVCALQCILAQLIDRIPGFQLWVDTYIDSGQWFYKEVGRLYGIGAALDPAGVRFAIVLLLIAYLLCEDEDIRQNRKKIVGFSICFFLISILGNMISRTTTVGMMIGLIYIVYSTGIFRLIIHARNFRFYSIWGAILIIFIVLGAYLYQTDESFYSNMRFAFEGFFSWVETGKWSTDSTAKLNSVMWVWPQDFKSWMIGTGLFGGYIYSTDIGYCRFILYCGLIGFGTFILFFIYNTWMFICKYPSCRLLALGILALSFVIWVKVATDLFLIYALFYCLDDESKKKSKLFS